MNRIDFNNNYPTVNLGRGALAFFCEKIKEFGRVLRAILACFPAVGTFSFAHHAYKQYKYDKEQPIKVRLSPPSRGVAGAFLFEPGKKNSEVRHPILPDISPDQTTDSSRGPSSASSPEPVSREEISRTTSASPIPISMMQDIPLSGSNVAAIRENRKSFAQDSQFSEINDLDALVKEARAQSSQRRNSPRNLSSLQYRTVRSEFEETLQPVFFDLDRAIRNGEDPRTFLLKRGYREDEIPEILEQCKILKE